MRFSDMPSGVATVLGTDPMPWSAIGRQPQEVGFAERGAGKLANPPSTAHHDDPIAGVDELLDVG
jgi:hypothetical protein